MKTLRITVSCPACGGPVGLREPECPYCGSKFETEEEITPYNLPSCMDNPHAREDAKELLPWMGRLDNNGWFRPIDVDELSSLWESIQQHRYSAIRKYIIELKFVLSDFRDLCMESTKERRNIQLDLLWRTEAIYRSLTGEDPS